jgi:hypothetical protein
VRVQRAVSWQPTNLAALAQGACALKLGSRNLFFAAFLDLALALQLTQSSGVTTLILRNASSISFHGLITLSLEKAAEGLFRTCEKTQLS